MFTQKGLSRRGFVGGVATAVGYMTLKSPMDLLAEGIPRPRRLGIEGDDYDLLAKVNFNENPYGPTESVLKAMTQAFKYANRY
ncbi:MAG TPA: hypothetical protein VK636_00665, partial [Gemmatimonadaceae bacterium]|nr:hypothetical protein [Gemmatimonadaceae bacterium]